MDMDETEERAGEERPLVWQPLAPVHSNLNHWVKVADRGFARPFARLLGECGIIASEWSALRQLYGPQWRSPIELGRMIGLSKGGASKLISRLVSKDLVDKRTNESDRRFRSVGLTRRGQAMVEFLAPLEKDCNRQFFSRLGNTRSFRLKEWIKQLLVADQVRRVDQWVAVQRKGRTFPRTDSNARAAAVAKAAAETEEFWQMCRLAGQKAAEEMFGPG
jgi:DNA-binding MarR family transcriptional regulator